MGHCLITGGSSGIGLSLARLLLLQGETVSLVARDLDKLESARSWLISEGARIDRIHFEAADVADEPSLRRAVLACEAVLGPVDIAIASAGVVTPSLFHTQDALQFDRQIAVNLTGVANTVRLIFPGMISAGRGRIMIISSGAALVSIPGYSAYCASKAALRAFTASLRLEAGSHGVIVSACFPPDTLTPQLEQEMGFRPAEARLFIGTHKPWDVDVVANRILKGLRDGRAEVHFGFTLTALAYIEPLIRPFLHRIYARKLKFMKR
jgi:3-dehydrosphinganine reductase